MKRTGIKKLYLLCMAACLFVCFWGGCGQAKKRNPSGNLTKITGQAPGKTIEEQIEEIVSRQGYPTAPPPREFVPGEGQTELVLWAENLDEYIVAELNHILQKRGYSFYLTVKDGEEEMKSAHYNRMDVWRDFFDAGKAVDLVVVDDGRDRFLKTYGKTDIERMITEGCLLPFSEYPDTPAKARLRAAYGEEYWRLYSFGGENYGISRWGLIYPPGKKYLVLNLDAAKKAGIEAPEELDLLHLDELLRKAAAAGIPGIGSNITTTGYYGVELLSCGLYAKQLPDGGYSFINPFTDEGLLGVFDAMNRYLENGWVEYDIGKLPLVMFVSVFGDSDYLEGDRFVMWTNGEKRSARVKVYEEGNISLREGNLLGLLGISSASRHKEEAVELLCLMHTDEEIVQLLRYGIEGIHYRLGEDGWEGEVNTTFVNVRNVDGVEKIVGYGIWTRMSPGMNTFGNPRMPLEFDRITGMWHRDDADFYRDISGTSLLPYPGDLLAGKEEELKKIRDILYVEQKGDVGRYTLEGIWLKKESGYKRELERMRAAFEAAGYNELVAELNQRRERQE